MTPTLTETTCIIPTTTTNVIIVTPIPTLTPTPVITPISTPTPTPTETTPLVEETLTPIPTPTSGPVDIEITSPKNGEKIIASDNTASVLLKVDVLSGSPDKVKVYVDDQYVETLTTFLWSYLSLTPGNHTIKVIAYIGDNVVDTDEITVEVEGFVFGKKYEAKVVEVIDGDTIDVMINDNTYRIRLLGIDCPEISPEENKPYEYDDITNLEYLAEWGLKAKEFTEKVLDHGTVYIEFDELAGLKGYYGRYLAYVYLPNGTDFNALLIKNGLARVYVEGTFKKESEYLKFENYAKTHKIGLWAYSVTPIVTTPKPTPTLTPTLTITGVRITYVHYDAPGNDWYNPNGEYVIIKNYGPDPVNLKGWKLKDEAGHTFIFPDVTLNPGETVRVYSGRGVNHDHVLYWGNGAIWNNKGDTAYLYDDSGKLVDTYSW